MDPATIVRRGLGGAREKLVIISLLQGDAEALCRSMNAFLKKGQSCSYPSSIDAWRSIYKRDTFLLSWLSLTNTGPWRRKLREAEYGSLEHDREFLEQISPRHKVDRITTPLFVVHGANDPRVPVGEVSRS